MPTDSTARTGPGTLTDLGTVTIETTGRVAIVRLNRPEARNALTVALMTALRTAMRQVEDDPAVNAVVLTGNGKAFCAGLDLKELGSTGANLGLGGAKTDGSASAPWEPISKPVIGAVNGPAVTGGFEVALACDILIGSDAACFADTHGLVGVLPGWGLSVLLPLVVGRGVARRMSLTGDYMFAAEALARGLLTEVVPGGELLPAALRIAQTIAGHDPRAMQAYLASYRRLELAQVGAGYAIEGVTSRDWLKAGYQRQGVEARREAVIARGRNQTKT
jgi:enoyl-CoA hydratase